MSLVIKNCIFCKTSFEVAHWVSKKGGGKYCSNSCKGKNNWQNPEYRKHMSDIHKGYAPVGMINMIKFNKTLQGRTLASLRAKNRTPWNKSKKGIYSAETLNKMSINRIGINKGADHYLWISDRTKIVGRHDRSFHDADYKQWVLNVRNRDGWKCKISNGDCSGRLETHHILGWKSYPELRYQVNNGITLCHFHHPRTRAKEAELSPYFQSLVVKGN